MKCKQAGLYKKKIKENTKAVKKSLNNGKHCNKS